MPAKRYSTEQIVSKLRQAEVELSRGLRVPLSVRSWGSANRPIIELATTYGRYCQGRSELSADHRREMSPVHRLPCSVIEDDALVGMWASRAVARGPRSAGPPFPQRRASGHADASAPADVVVARRPNRPAFFFSRSR